MDAHELLQEYGRRHDARDWDGLAALFTEDGELVFHGLPVPTACGPEAIARRLRERGPDDALLLGEGCPQADGAIGAVYGWAKARELVAGEVYLTPRGDRIARFEVHACVPRVPRERTSVRAVLLAPGPQVLLFRIEEHGRGWWITPGGGLREGEDDLAG